MELISGIITGIRNIRGEMNIPPSLSLTVMVQSQNESTRNIVRQHQDLIINLAKLDSITVQEPGERPPTAATAIVDGASIFVSLEGIIDFAKEKARLAKEITKLTGELTAISKKLGNENFLDKAPEEIVEKVKKKYARAVEKQQKLQATLEKVKELA
jgi:valyl-tRNA synthetase